MFDWTEEWKVDLLLIITLGALAFLQPLLDHLGITDSLNGNFKHLIFLVVISLIWGGVICIIKVQHPVIVLLLIGISYGLFSLFLKDYDKFSQMFTVVMWNAIWGITIGIFVHNILNDHGQFD